MDLILIGIQGSGKGTQASILSKNDGYKIFETGGELRSLAKKNSPLGIKIKNIMERGDLVSNEIVMEIVENFIQTIKSDDMVIFDGIPRSEEQRKSLELLLKGKGRDFKAIEIKLEKEVVLKRLLKRAEIEGRSDDNEETIKKRIENFFKHTEPLLNAWRSNNKLESIDGDQSIEAVANKIKTLL